jgi:hypothetical protein
MKQMSKDTKVALANAFFVYIVLVGLYWIFIG